MDKFGIFNILNLLLGNKAENTESEKVANSSMQDLLSNLLSTKKEEVKKATPTTVPLPLQASMVSTMTAHDEFIKRVKEKSKSPLE